MEGRLPQCNQAVSGDSHAWVSRPAQHGGTLRLRLEGTKMFSKVNSSSPDYAKACSGPDHARSGATYSGTAALIRAAFFYLPGTEMDEIASARLPTGFNQQRRATDARLDRDCKTFRY